MHEMRERQETRITPSFLARKIGIMELVLIETGKAKGWFALGRKIRNSVLNMLGCDIYQSFK